ARSFLACNSRFLANRESAEVYLSQKMAFDNNAQVQNEIADSSSSNLPARKDAGLSSDNNNDLKNNPKNYAGKFQSRAVVPQQTAQQRPEFAGGKGVPQSKQVDETWNLSKLAPSETEFRQLMGEANDGTLSRYVDDKLNVLFWYRATRE